MIFNSVYVIVTVIFFLAKGFLMREEYAHAVQMSELIERLQGVVERLEAKEKRLTKLFEQPEALSDTSVKEIN